MYFDRRLLPQLHLQRRGLGLSIACGAGAGLATIAQAWFLVTILNASLYQPVDLWQLSTPIIFFVAATLLRALLQWLSQVLAAKAAIEVKYALRQRLHRRVRDIGPVGLSTEHSGEIGTLGVDGIEVLDAYVSQYLPQLVLAAVVPLSVAVVVLWHDALSGIVLLLTAPLIPLFMVLIGSMAQRLAQQQLQQLQRLGAVFVDAIVGVTTLKLFARTRAYTEIIAHTAEAFRDSTMKTLRIAFTSALVLELIATLSTAIVAVEVGLRLLYGRLVFEQAFLILLLAPEFYLPLRLLGTRFHAGMAGVEATRRIFALLNKADTLVKRGHVAAPLPTHIVFKQVRFTYANSAVVTSHRPTPAVDSIDLELKPNKLLALVGPSGAGKSSIVRLLLRFIDPEQGDIFVNDINLVDIDVQSWRQRIAWVAERPYLFASSVADNIRLGQHQASEADVVNAARTAHAEDFIRQLPNGFNSSVGEHGVNLAGGEAQRIAIARAILKNAPLVVLDEYSAHLDAIANAKLQLASRELIQNRCALVVAHRLATVQAADEIVVLDAGRIVDRGTHEQLLRHCPLYQSLVTSFEATP